MNELLNDDLLHELSKLADQRSSSPQANLELAYGERRPAAILFLDVVDFTGMAEKLSPEELKLVVDKAFDVFTRQVVIFQGVVDNYLGDAILAVFGKQSNDNPAELAVRAALANLDRLTDINALLSPFNIKLRIRQGINYGDVIAGHTITSDPTTTETVYGDTVNTAKRLQELAEPDAIVIAEDVYKLLPDFFTTIQNIEATAKGKKLPVRAYIFSSRSAMRTKEWHRHPLHIKTKLVGRAEQLAAAVAHYSKAYEQYARPVPMVKPQAYLLLIEGDAGYGKSRLVLELKNDLTARMPKGVEDLTLRNYSFTTPAFSELGAGLDLYLPAYQRKYRLNSPGEALVALLDVNGEHEASGLAKRHMADLAAIFPILGDFQSPHLGLQELEDTCATVLVAFCRAAARHAFQESGAPLILVWDDMQWVDQPSLRLFNKLLAWQSRDPVPLFIVLTMRPGLEMPAYWASQANLLRIELAPLTTTQTMELVQRILPGLQLASEDEELLREKTVGNPYFVEEFCRLLLEQGIVSQLTPAKYQWQRPGGLRGISIPPTVNAVLMHRIDSLEPEAKDLVQMASVIGREFPLAVLEAVMHKANPGLSKEKLSSHLSMLESIGMVFPLRRSGEVGGDTGLRLIFKHNLLRDLAYNSLLTQNQRLLHCIVAQAYEETYSGEDIRYWEVISQHYFLAEEFARANYFTELRKRTESAQQGRTKSLQNIAERIAVARSQATQDALQTECDLTCQLAEAYANLHRTRELKALLASLRPDASRRASPEQIIRLQAARSAVLVVESDGRNAVKQVSKLHDELFAAGPLDVLGTASAELVRVLMLVGSAADAQIVAEQALKKVTPTSAPAGRVKVLIQLACALRELCRFREGALALQEAASIAREAREGLLEAVALLEFGKLRRITGNYQAAAENVRAALNGFLAEEDLYHAAVAYAEQAELELRAGTLGNASDILSRMNKAAEGFSSPELSLTEDTVRAMLCARRKESGEAIKLLDGALKLAHEKQYAACEISLTVRQAALLTDLGDPIKALKTLDRIQDLAQELRNQAQIGTVAGETGHANLQRGLFASAKEHLERSLQTARNNNLPEETILRSLQLGRTLYGLGKQTEGILYVQNALNKANDIGSTYLASRSHYHFAMLLSSVGRKADAKQHFQDALELADAAEDAVFADKVRTDGQI